MLIHYSKCDHARFAKTLKVNVGTGFNVLQRCHKCTFQTYGQANHQCGKIGTVRDQWSQIKDDSSGDGPNKEDTDTRNPKLGEYTKGGTNSGNTTDKSSEKGNSKAVNQNVRSSAETSVKGKADVANNNLNTTALGKADVEKPNVPVGSASTDSKGLSQTHVRNDHMTKEYMGKPNKAGSASTDTTVVRSLQQHPSRTMRLLPLLSLWPPWPL